jgi:hypothetical protein
MTEARQLRAGEEKERTMAVATCIKCESHSFELALLTPIGVSKKLTLVQCAQCGAAVGALDPATGPQIETLQRQIAAIDDKLNRIATALQE